MAVLSHTVVPYRSHGLAVEKVSLWNYGNYEGIVSPYREINSWEFDTSVEMISMVLSLHIEFMGVWVIVPVIVLRNYKAFHCPTNELLIARHCASN